MDLDGVFDLVVVRSYHKSLLVVRPWILVVTAHIYNLEYVNAFKRLTPTLNRMSTSDITGPSAYFFAYLGCAVALVFASTFSYILAMLTCD